MFQCFYKHYLNAFIANFYICVSFQGVLYWLLSPLDYSHDFLLFCISNNFLLYARPLFSGFSAPRGEAKPPLAGKHQPLPSAMSPLLVGRCCLLSTRSLSKEEESEWDVRVRKGPGLPATPHFAKFRPHPPFGMKLLKGPSSGCPWGVVLFLLRGVGFTGLVKCALPLPSWKPRMLVRLLEALSGGALNSQKGHQDWRLGILTSLPWMGGGGKVFPKGTGAAAWGYSVTVPVITLTRRGLPIQLLESHSEDLRTICHVWSQENWGKVCRCGLGIEEKGKRSLFWVLGRVHCEGAQGKASSDSVTVHLNGERGIPLLSLARPKAQASEIWEELFCRVWSPWRWGRGALWVVGCGREASHRGTNSWANTEKVHKFPQ